MSVIQLGIRRREKKKTKTAELFIYRVKVDLIRSRQNNTN